MGIMGAALATVIAQSAGMLTGLYYILADKTGFRIDTQCLIPNWSMTKKIYRVGAPASIQMLTETIAFVMCNRVASVYGSVPPFCL
jgi:Na+-driven multidrug efflux pump